MTAANAAASAPASLADKPRVRELDGLRGLAILLVLVWHYFVCLVQPAQGSWWFRLMPWLGLTWSGVDLFFVLSGYLLGGILMDNVSSPNYFKTFYVRRACRILPIYYALLLVAGAAALAGFTRRNPSLAFLTEHAIPWWSYPTFLQNFAMAGAGHFGSYTLGVTWSLAIEEQFYLVLPWLVRAVPPADLPRVLVAGALAGPVCRVFLLLFQDPNGFAGYVLMPARADALLLGALTAWAMRRADLPAKLAGNRALAYGILAALLAGAATLRAFGGRLPPFVTGGLGFTWLALTYAWLLALAVTKQRGPVSLLTRVPALGWLGTVSYGVYLLHQPVNGLAHALLAGRPPMIQNARDAAITLGALAVTLALATASWHLFEKRFLRLGHAFRY
jgi:peptidoglycan/LPS O-acetylase OafA/YrhL